MGGRRVVAACEAGWGDRARSHKERRAWVLQVQDPRLASGGRPQWWARCRRGRVGSKAQEYKKRLQASRVGVLGGRAVRYCLAEDLTARGFSAAVGRRC